jgi:uncharacterized protein YbjT (DUF2867 family)
MFAIMGVTGKVGGAVARSLIAKGQHIRVIVRDSTKGEPWAAQGCEVAVASLDEPEALASAFEGANGIFAMLPPVFDPSPDFAEAKAMIATLRTAIDIAQPARLVVLSTIGADAVQPNLLNQLAMLEAGLTSAAPRTTFLRAAWFMDNAAGDLADARTGTIHSHLQPTDRSIAMIASEDVGRTAAALLLEFDAPAIMELEAASRVSPDVIATAYARALGHPVQAVTVPRDRWEAEFRAAGMTNPLPRMQMVDGFNQGWIDFTGGKARKGTMAIDEVVADIVAAG